jgi:hypothetical protein
MTGWFGNAFILTGISAVAYKKRWGFILGIIGNLLWAIRGLSTCQYDLIAIQVIIVLLQGFSYWNWGRDYVGTDNDIHKPAGTEQ